MPDSAIQPDLRAEEVAYWDAVAMTRGWKDNIFKRQRLIAKILEEGPIGQRIVEIGVGNGLTAAVINLATLGNINYVGTDISPVWCRVVEQRWKLRMAHCDVRGIPIADAQADQIWAFDTLEHVRPEDRDAGNQEINRILATKAKILLNVPLSPTKHDLQFDHPYDESDVAALCAATGTRVTRMERYEAPEVGTAYQFVVLVR